MKAAIPYRDGEVFGHFGRTETFKLYNIEDGKVASSVLMDTGGEGHGALAGLLKQQGVSILICGGIGQGAIDALSAAGIEVYPGETGPCDGLAKALAEGTLEKKDTVACAHHHHAAGEGCHHGNQQI